jgi:hypothetical protein
MLEAIKAKDPAKHAAIKLDTITDDEVVNLHEAVCGPLVPEPARSGDRGPGRRSAADPR